jgi:hypothetical protein
MTPSATGPERRPFDGTAGAGLFVWGTWLALTVAGLWFICAYSPSIPMGDEYYLVPVLTGHERLSVEWLWSQVNEHRLPLVKLILFGLARATNYHFWAQDVLNLALLSGATAALILAARRARGYTRFADAAFPLLLLHWGHSEVYLGCIELNHCLSSVLAVGILLMIIAQRDGPSGSSMLILGTCLTALPLCGANGLPIVVAAAVWLLWGAVRGLRSPQSEDRRRAVAMLGLAASSLSIVALYWHGFHSPNMHLPEPRLGAVLRTTLQALSKTCVELNPEIARIGKLSVPLLAAWAAVTLLAAWRRREERFRATGLLLFLSAMAGMALAIGWSRAWVGADAGLVPRYGIALLPALLAIYLIWCHYGSHSCRNLGQMTIFVIACMFFVPRMIQGWKHAEAVRTLTQSFEQEILDGEPAPALAEHHPWPIIDATFAEARFIELREAGVWPFRHMRDAAPVCTAVAVPLAPSAVYDMSAVAAGWTATGPLPALEFTLEQPRLVYGIRLRYRLASGKGFIGSTLYWAGEEGEITPTTKRYRWFRSYSGVEWRTHTVWVNERITRFRFRPTDGACNLEIAAIELLVPSDEVR